ncbi:MAG: hypothetical protein KDC03_23145, partial [Flavobacteriales bacterium]|nr:hypothetical protein [Flavobacteriales bacterium]
LEQLIRSAVRVAMDHLVPQGLDGRLWRTLEREERYFLKGLEVEHHGEYRNGVYQEMARGFGVEDYKDLMESGGANATRLRTAIEFRNRMLGGTGFDGSLVRHILFAIRETHRAQDPAEGRNYLHQEPTVDYWNARQRIVQLLAYLERQTEGLPHWAEDREALRLLKGFVENDRV